MSKEILVILFLMLLIILILFILARRSNAEMILKLSDDLQKNIEIEKQQNLVREKQQLEMLYQFQERLQHSLQVQNKLLEDNLDKRLYALDQKVNHSLAQGFSKTQDTFTHVSERLATIDEAQKNIDKLSSDLISLQDILTDKSSRGIFGEIQLNQILYAIFGEKNDEIYQIQYKLSNQRIADAILFAPEPLGNIVIDSKFPLENYDRLIKAEGLEKEKYKKEFVRDFKKHIDDIASRYIVKDETAQQAFLFLPAEAIFAYINAYHPDIIAYSQRKSVWIVSPTTLMSTLTTVQSILKNIEREKYAHIIQDELEKLGVEFARFHQRWLDLSRHLEMVNGDMQKLHITGNKLHRQFEMIAKVDKDLIKDD